MSVYVCVSFFSFSLVLFRFPHSRCRRRWDIWDGANLEHHGYEIRVDLLCVTSILWNMCCMYYVRVYKYLYWHVFLFKANVEDTVAFRAAHFAMPLVYFSFFFSTGKPFFNSKSKCEIYDPLKIQFALSWPKLFYRIWCDRLHHICECADPLRALVCTWKESSFFLYILYIQRIV